MTKLVEDMREMWEKGISVKVIAEKYGCSEADVMTLLGIWE